MGSTQKILHHQGLRKELECGVAACLTSKSGHISVLKARYGTASKNNINHPNGCCRLTEQVMGHGQEEQAVRNFRRAHNPRRRLLRGTRLHRQLQHNTGGKTSPILRQRCETGRAYLELRCQFLISSIHLSQITSEYNFASPSRRDTHAQIAQVCRSSTAWAKSCRLQAVKCLARPSQGCSRWCKSL